MGNIGTCVVVLNDLDQVLVGKRKNAYKSGLYGLPGGRVGKGEKLTEAASRELKEETNFKALQLEYLGVVRETQERYDFIHFAFYCREYDGELKNMEPEKCKGWEWSDLDNLPDGMLRAHRTAVDFVKDLRDSTIKMPIADLTTLEV